jgi:ParB-like chromosome segregation protein Spo0J
MSTAPITIFDEMTAGSVKGMAKDTGSKSAEFWMVPYKELRIADGFNVRVHDKDYQAHIDWLSGQMRENGYKRDKPMTGYVAKEDGKNVVYITDGHSRYAAIEKARAAGAEIELIPVIVHPPGTSAEDLTVALVTANAGRPLSPFELATVCKRLQGYGHDDKSIAKKLGYTVPYVKNLFELLAAPRAVRDMVTSGKVSATLAVQTIKAHGKDASAVLKAGATEAEAKGKAKVTGKHVKKASTPAKPAKPGKKQAAPAQAETTQAALPLDGADDAAVDLIQRMADYIRTVRVGNDAQDLLDAADAIVNQAEEDL